MTNQMPRAIAVLDVGFTNTKLVLFSSDGTRLGERKMASLHREGPPYRHIDPAPVAELCRTAFAELDSIAPIDVIVPSAHGACVTTLRADGSLAFPVMDYTAEPPAEVAAAYAAIAPPFEESYCATLPMSLLQGMQLFWQQTAWPDDFRQVATILPWIQYISFMLTGRAVSEISSMACQSHLVDVNTGGPSSLSRRQGWDTLFAPRAQAWDVIGSLKPEFRGSNFRGRGAVLAGVHDSNANYLRYLAAGVGQFTLLSTGTWIIGFDTAADIRKLDHTRDTVTNTDVLGRPVACCRFFGGREFEALSKGAAGELASLSCLADLVDAGIMALPSFSDSGGPVANTGGRGVITGGPVESPAGRATLASLYCALMVSESLDAIQSRHAVIVDGPFAQNAVFLSVLAALRPGQKILASDLRDGTTAGAACLALMPDGKIPHIALSLTEAMPAVPSGLAGYQQRWRRETARHAAAR